MASIGNPFYNPRSDYYGDQDFRTTPFVRDFLDPKIPRGVYTDWLAGMGLVGQDRRSQWAQSLFDESQNGYQAASRINPALTYLQYLHKQLGRNQLDTMWAAMTPGQRGERVSNFSPDTRFISWG